MIFPLKDDKCWWDACLCFLWLMISVSIWTIQPTDAVLLSFESAEELVEAVDVLLDNDNDSSVLEIIGSYGPIDQWDTSQVKDFSSLFSKERNSNSESFSADLSLWNVSQVTDFSYMFYKAADIDFDASRWDVSSGKNFSGMFHTATSFRGVGLASWNVSSGEDFTKMFRRATSFGSSDNSDFNNLCSWTENIKVTAITKKMFADSQCPESEKDPDIAAYHESFADQNSNVSISFCQACYRADIEQQESTAEPTKQDEDNIGPSRPNILFFITDQQRFDTIRWIQDELPYYDNHTKINTPNLDKLLLEGAYFRNAYCQCAVCAPARTTLRTGCTIERTGVQSNDLAEDYNHGELFSKRVEALIGIDQILVEQYGYISEYYGKWHIPDILAQSKSNQSETIVRFNDFDYFDEEFYFEVEDSSKKIRRYLKEHEKLGILTPEQKLIDTVAVNLTKSFPGAGRQIDTYTRYPYDPIQLDTRYGAAPDTPLKEEHGFDSSEVSQSNVLGVYALSDKFTPTHFTSDIALRALQRLKKESDPWFLTISFHHPHPPFVAPFEPYLSKYWEKRENLFVPPSINDPMTNSPYKEIQIPGYRDPRKVQEWMAIYFALIEEVDNKIGEMLEELGEDAENTLVIFTSDHGEMLGSHGKRSKSNFYEEASHVPLLIRYPGMIEPGTQVEDIVSHLDIFSTILDYAGAPEADNSDGRSLRPFIEGTEYNKDFDEGDVVFAEWDFRMPTSVNSSELDRDIDDRPSFLIRKGNYKLMMQKVESTEELDMMIDLESDPFEVRNLLGLYGMSASDSVIRKAEHMRCLLMDWMQRLDGEVGYYSDPAANYGQGKGDISEIRSRQSWKEIGFWTSDDTLEFGRMTTRKEGGFIRHEHLYFGTRKQESVTVSLVEITGVDAEYFTLDQEEITFGHNDCRSIRVTFVTPENLWWENKIDAALIFEVNIQLQEPQSENIAQQQSTTLEIRLTLSDYKFGVRPPQQEDENMQEDDDAKSDAQEDLSDSTQGSVDTFPEEEPPNPSPVASPSRDFVSGSIIRFAPESMMLCILMFYILI